MQPLALSDRDDDHRGTGCRTGWEAGAASRRRRTHPTLLARAEVTTTCSSGTGLRAAPQPKSWPATRGRTWESDPNAANLVRHVRRPRRRPGHRGRYRLSDASADVVIGEAMLTMQGNAAKHTIVAEAARVLRPGGRYAIHEPALVPDDAAEQVRTDLRQFAGPRSRSRASADRCGMVAPLWAMDWSRTRSSPLPWRCYNRATGDR